MQAKKSPAFDWAVVVLGVCLLAVIVGIVAVVHRDGLEQLKGTGLGALATLLAGALAWRVKNKNGKNGTG